jgi:hypothetical protein
MKVRFLLIFIVLLTLNMQLKTDFKFEGVYKEADFNAGYNNCYNFIKNRNICILDGVKYRYEFNDSIGCFYLPNNSGSAKLKLLKYNIDTIIFQSLNHSLFAFPNDTITLIKVDNCERDIW